jgi:hypothetical protein
VLESRALRGIFGLTREEMTGGWRNCKSTSSSPIITKLIHIYLNINKRNESLYIYKKVM